MEILKKTDGKIESGKHKISWTDRTWNPVTGCTKVSAGCKFCYAETNAKRFWGGRKFTDVKCHEDRLSQPLNWNKPSKVFVNSMSDLFHGDVPFDFIATVFGIMAWASDHTFQILTKRPERAIDFFKQLDEGKVLLENPREDLKYDNYQKVIQFAIHYVKHKDTALMQLCNVRGLKEWPPRNIWIGVSVENQETADQRIPLLLQIPAAVRFLSCEPLLSPIDLTKIKRLTGTGWKTLNSLSGTEWFDDVDCNRYDTYAGKVDWVIVGGESGSHARPMDVDWARSIKDQCHQAEVPFFMKQFSRSNYGFRYQDFESFPEDLRIREFPNIN